MGKKKKALIVEDETISALSLEEIVRDLGYETCESASNGKDAVAKVEACKPDIVLMDVNLHGEMDGIEAAKVICSKRQVPVLFISGYLDEDVKARFLFPGAVDYINKPIDFDELREKMEALLSRGAIRRRR